MTSPSDPERERQSLAARLVDGELKLTEAGMSHPGFWEGFERWSKLLERYEELVLEFGEE